VRKLRVMLSAPALDLDLGRRCHSLKSQSKANVVQMHKVNNSGNCYDVSFALFLLGCGITKEIVGNELFLTSLRLSNVQNERS